MPALPKKLMRSLPTLTEVVDTAVTSPDTVAVEDLDEEALMHRVLQRLELTLDDLVRQVVASALEEQMKELAPRIRQRVDNAVRKAVSQAVASELKPPLQSR